MQINLHQQTQHTVKHDNAVISGRVYDSAGPRYDVIQLNISLKISNDTYNANCPH